MHQKMRPTTPEKYQHLLPPSLRPQSLITHPLHFIVSWTLFITLLPLALLIIASLWVYRAVIRLMARREGLSSPLTPYDSIFAVDSYYTRPYASNLTVLEMKSRVNLDQIKRLFKTRILNDPAFEKLSCIPVEYISYWFWKKLEYPRLEDSVQLFYDSELSNDTRSVDECLREIVEMPFKDQLFNVLVMHFGTKSYVVFRIHHTVCDGYSFNHLIDKFVGLESKYLVKAKELTWNEAFKSWSIGVRKWITLLTHMPVHIIALFCESVTHSPNFYTLRKHNTSGLIRRTILPLSPIKKIRQTSNSHVASIGMSMMTGALQKYYDETQPNSAKLRPSRLAIMHSLPKPNHPISTLCNHWGVGLFKIPFIRDSVARMYGAEQDFNEYTGLGYDTVLRIHFPIVVLVPTWVVKWFFSINFGTSCGFTSVPGLFDKIAYLGEDDQCTVDEDGFKVRAGVEVAHMWKVFGLQWRQSAVAVAMYTYRGEASVSFYANKDIIPDNAAMDRLMELFHEEFNQLVNYANTPPTTTLINGNGPKITDGELLKKNGTKLIDACFNVRDNKLA